MRHTTGSQNLAFAVIVCFALISSGCKAGEPAKKPMGKMQDKMTIMMQTPDWAGVKTISVICRVNKELAGGFSSQKNSDLDHIEQEVRALVCGQTKNALEVIGNLKNQVAIKDTPDGEMLAADHVGVMMDITVEWRDQPFEGIAIVIASHLFRHNPSGPAGAFFRSQAGVLLFTADSVSDFDLDSHAEAIQVVIDNQVTDLLQ